MAAALTSTAVTYQNSAPLSKREFLYTNALRILALGFAVTISALAVASIIENETKRHNPLFNAASGIIGFSSFTNLSNRLRDIFTNREYSLLNKIAIVLGVMTALIQTILGALGASKIFLQPPANWPLLSGTGIAFLIIADWLKGQRKTYNIVKFSALTLTSGGAASAAYSITNPDNLTFYNAASLSLTTGYCLTAASRGHDIWINKNSNTVNRNGVVLSVFFYFAAALSSLLSILKIIEPVIAVPLLLTGLGFLAFIMANMIFKNTPTEIARTRTITPVPRTSIALGPLINTIGSIPEQKRHGTSLNPTEPV